MATATAKVPTSEIGQVAPSLGAYGLGVVDDGEETAAWVWPHSVRTAERMRRSGPIHTVLSAVTHPVRRPGLFAIDPQGADPARVATLAEDLDLPILGTERPPPLRRRGRFSWLEHVRLALLELAYGHMAFELVCNEEVLDATGEARLHKLAPRFPTTITKIEVEPDGGLKSITQRVQGWNAKPIPVANLVWYANEREGAAWQGRSILRPCYGSWMRLDRMLRARAYLMERQSMGVPVGEAPEGAGQDVVDLMRDIAMGSRAGDHSGVGIPHGANLTFEGVRGTLPDITEAIVQEQAMLAETVMAQWMRLGTQEASGNRALGQTFVDQFTQSEDAVAGHIADVATQHVVEDLWDWNYGTSAPAPAITAQPVDAERHIDTDQLIRLIEIGAITPDESIEDLLRQRARVPKRTAPRPAPDNNPTPPVAAGRRSRTRNTNHMIRAAEAGPWADRVAEALSTAVDAEAIAGAALAGAEPAAAVAEGLSADTGPLAALLVEMWGEGYGAGQAKAADTAPVAATRRPSLVMASLSDIIARAGEVASGILSSLADRLAARLAGDDVPDTADALADVLEGLGSDAAAAERIAVTEAHRARVAGAVDTWASMGITETRWVRTSTAYGDYGDDECGERDGTTSASWDPLPPLHPWCGCEVEPVTPVAAARQPAEPAPPPPPPPPPAERDEDERLEWRTLIGAVAAMASREPATPSVVVNAPPAPVVNVAAPEAPAPSVVVEPARAPQPRARRIERDAAGNITRVVEES